jgi:tetratricopeptide (TPR) repeat protein
MVSLQTANKHAGAKQFKDAIEYYTRATRSWDGNHLAWYGLGGALAQQGEWKDAFTAFEHAVSLRPDVPMYQMWTGIASYETAAKQARIDQAAKQSKKPEEIRADLSNVDFAQARGFLESAITLEPTLWRAHYYLGRIFRDGGYDQRAAESFTAAIKADRRQQGPYIALGELYRKWGFAKEAVAVTTIGVQMVPGDIELSDVHYVLGMAYEDQNDHKHAIEAFTKALENKPDNAKAQFQRGQAYFKLKKYKEAKVDLEAFVAAPGTQLEFARQQAQKMLMDLAATKKK